MKITTRRVGDAVVLAPRGAITVGEGDARLRRAVREALDAEAAVVVVDLAGATTIDSSGIGELVSAHTAARKRGGSLRLTGVPRRTRELLRLTRLDTVLEIHDTVDEALAGG